jgi:hypothetical protein
MRTFPPGNKVAVCHILATDMLPVGTRVPCNTVAPTVPAELVDAPLVPVVPAEPVTRAELVAPPVVPVVPPLLPVPIPPLPPATAGAFGVVVA